MSVERICVKCNKPIHDGAWLETTHRNNWNGLVDYEYEHLQCPSPCPACKAAQRELADLRARLEARAAAHSAVAAKIKADDALAGAAEIANLMAGFFETAAAELRDLLRKEAKQ